MCYAVEKLENEIATVIKRDLYRVKINGAMLTLGINGNKFKSPTYDG